MTDSNQIEIYKAAEGEVVFRVDSEEDTIWATQEQLAKVFNVDRSRITHHLRNIFNDGELDEKAVCAFSAQTENGNSPSCNILLICLVTLDLSTSYSSAICACVSQRVSSLGLTLTSKLKSPSSNLIISYFVFSLFVIINTSSI